VGGRGLCRPTWLARAADEGRFSPSAIGGHDFIGTEHLLLGLTGIDQGLGYEVLRHHGVGPGAGRREAVRLLQQAGVGTDRARTQTEALAAVGIDVEEVRRRADEAFGPGRFRFPQPAFMVRAKKALERAGNQALALEHTYIGTEHLLLSLIEDPESLGAKVLVALDANLARLRDDVLGRVASKAS
jgi:ATP-dependent Clp protease ATP-binding subunit ClpC